MKYLYISSHAIEQYESRVLACPERSRTREQLIAAIQWQLRENPMKSLNKALVITCGPWRPRRRKPWEMTVNYPTHMFVVDENTVVTTLGFMMRPKKRAGTRSRKRQHAKYLEAIKGLPRVCLTTSPPSK